MNILRIIALLLSALTLIAQAAEDMVFEVRSNLQAGVGKSDITPENVTNFEVVGHTRTVNGVRDPIRAAVLLLDDGQTKASTLRVPTIPGSK